MREFLVLPALLLLTGSPGLGQDRKEDLLPGLIGEFYTVGEPMEGFPDLGRKQPAVRRIEPKIDYRGVDGPFAGTFLNSYFCVRWTGSLRIPKDGSYTFYTVSDDGSRLFLDGKQVVDNGGLHVMEEKRADIELKAGLHSLTVEFFENTGAAGCRVLWEADGLEKAPLPPRLLFHRRDPALDGE